VGRFLNAIHLHSLYESLCANREVYMSESAKCVLNKLPLVISKVLGLDESYVAELIATGKLKTAPTPDPKFGDFGIAIHVLLKGVDRDMWEAVGKAVGEELYNVTREECNVEKVEFINGYLNVYVDYRGILSRLSEDILGGRLKMELESIGKGVKVIVEHTSANPVHPLHIGSGRNSVIGDVFARLLRKLGFNVETRFYVNDLGRQVATLIYGVKVLESSGLTRPGDIKPDHWYGVVYAATNIIIEEDRLREAVRAKVKELYEKVGSLCKCCLEGSINIPRELCVTTICSLTWKARFKRDPLKDAKKLYSALKGLKEAQNNPVVKSTLTTLEELRELVREYASYVKAREKIAITYPEIYTTLKASIGSWRKAEEEINKLMMLAEMGDVETITLFRRVVLEVLEGFKETLKKIDIEFTGFDFESDSEIVSLAHEIVDRLLQLGYAKVIEGGAVEVDLDSAAEKNEYVKTLFYPDRAGRFIVKRSDGTTLYVTRDIAYSLYKFKRRGAKVVYNVIAVEQSREQKQLKAVLHLLGYSEEAENLKHFAYEMVHLKGMRMSGRRGIYYTVDELLEDAKVAALKKLLEVERHLDMTEALAIAEKLAVANVRSLLVSVDPSKVLVFDPDKIGEVEYGSMIEYAFVRAQGVVRNLWKLEFLDDQEAVINAARELLKTLTKEVNLSVEEKKIIEDIAKFPEQLRSAYIEMSPNKVLEYALTLSLDFNKFYEKHPVIAEKDPAKKSVRALITVLTLLVLSELMDILGIPKLRKM
jgi:arginyl-tRNA synthetase